MTVHLNVNDGIIRDIGIIANGCCVISQGSAHHMVEYFTGKHVATLQEAELINITDVSPDVRGRIGCLAFPIGILYEASKRWQTLNPKARDLTFSCKDGGEIE